MTLTPEKEIVGKSNLVQEKKRPTISPSSSPCNLRQLEKSASRRTRRKKSEIPKNKHVERGGGAYDRNYSGRRGDEWSPSPRGGGVGLKEGRVSLVHTV